MPLHNGSFSRASVGALTAKTAQLQQQFLGSLAPEVLTASGTCGLVESTSRIDASAAGASFTVTLPDATSARTQSYNTTGLVKCFVMTTTPAPGVQVTIAPATPAGLQQSALTGANQTAMYVWDDVSGWSIVGGGGGGGSGSVLLGQSLFVSETTGNNATALPDHVELPYATIQAAIDAAVPGDVVYIYPGDYVGFTAKTGVTVTGIDASHYNGAGMTGPYRIHAVQINGTVTVPFNVAPEPFITISNMRIVANANAAAVLFNDGNSQIVLFDDVVMIENAAGNSTVAVVQMGTSKALFNNCCVQTNSGSTTFAVRASAGGGGNSSITAFYSAIVGNWQCDDADFYALLYDSKLYTGNFVGVPAEMYAHLEAERCTFESLDGAVSGGLLLRNQARFQNCTIRTPVTIPANAVTGPSSYLDAKFSEFNSGITNLLVSTSTLDYSIRLTDCIIGASLDLSTPSAIRFVARNCTFELFFGDVVMAAEATGLGGSFTYENCVINVFGNHHMVLQQTVVVFPSLTSLTMKNCAVTCSTGTACVQFQGPVDNTSASNFRFANNSFDGSNFGVGADNSTFITSGGNTVGTAPGYDLNITLANMLTVF